MLSPIIKLIQLIEFIWFIKKKREANGDVPPNGGRETDSVRTENRPTRGDLLDDVPSTQVAHTRPD